MKKKRTIYNIASELSVSPGTISKVINNNGKVSAETRARVLEYIKQVGYVPAMSARMLKSKLTRTIGIIYSEELSIGLEHSFFSSILQHFKTYAENEGYELSFIVTKLGKNQLSYYNWCVNKRVDGVYIVVGDYYDQGIHELIKSEFPCISTDLIMPGLHTVISDNDLGTKRVLEYIKNKLKKQNVGLIAGSMTSKAFEQRLVSFRKYAQELNLNYDESDIVVAEGFGFTSGYTATEYLVNNWKFVPDVIFVTSDDLATGVIKALQSHGYRVPEDIQIIGFDDVPLARYITPSLTTVVQNRKALGETAAKLLIQMIEKPEEKVPEVTLLPVEIIKRESTIEVE